MFDKNFKIKIGLFVIMFLLTISFFSINWYVINQFRKQLNKQVETVVNIYHDKLSTDVVDSDYLLKTLLPLINRLDIPIIITTIQSNGKIVYKSLNLEIPIFDTTQQYSKYMVKMVNSMDNNNKPLPLMVIDEKPLIQIHFGDSFIINSMKWIPYIQLCFAFLIFILVFLGLRLLVANEKNYIYAGMSRETAHQLGTPISSLMGWLELLKKDNSNKNDIIKSMKEDISKLEKISDKFNKIGSKPTLTKINLNKILIDATNYYQSKLPKTSKINLTLTIQNEIFVVGDKILLYWAFENIIKNSIEAILSKKNGIVEVICRCENDKNVLIEFKDNGRGILRKNRNNIFSPGFSTKNRGWGIGLNLSKRIIEHIHRGSLKLSKTSSNGTTFKIILKLAFS